MNTCDRIRDILLTDYSDGELSPDGRRSVQSHLQACPACRDFWASLKEAAVAPFERAGALEAPESLWASVKARIIEDRLTERGPASVLKRFFSPFMFPRLAPAWGGFLVLLLIGSLAARSIQIQHAHEQARAEYLVSIVQTAEVLAGPGAAGVQTPLEQYFL